MNKHEIYMKIAYNVAELSHCVSHKVGAIIVKDGRILSTGINGTPKNFTNCDEKFNKSFDKECHHNFSEKFEIHAETNAIIFAAKNGISIEGSVMYSTLHPCYQCLKIICNSGITQIFYSEDYERFENDDDINTMLKESNVTLTKLQI